MSKVTEIRDPKTLQEVASHLEKTVIRQHKEIAGLRLDIARLRGQDVSPQMELELLKEQLEAMKRSMFGTSSERRPEDSSNGDQKKDKGEKKPKGGHGPRSQPDLPIEKIVQKMGATLRIVHIVKISSPNNVKNAKGGTYQNSCAPISASGSSPLSRATYTCRSVSSKIE